MAKNAFGSEKASIELLPSVPLMSYQLPKTNTADSLNEEIECSNCFLIGDIHTCTFNVLFFSETKAACTWAGIKYFIHSSLDNLISDVFIFHLLVDYRFTVISNSRRNLRTGLVLFVAFFFSF